MNKFKPTLKGDIKELERVRDNIASKIDAITPRRDFLKTKIESLNGELYDIEDKILSLTKENEKITGYISDMNLNDCNCYKIDGNGEITYYKMISKKN